MKRPESLESGRIRIIGGDLRGRRLSVPHQRDLRPTPDRVRETLFNWLAPLIRGSRCLDLFAGSGALGFEAASRGADRVVMLDRVPATIRFLQANRRLFALEHQIEIIQVDALQWLRTARAEWFDVIFLDPPFDADLLGPCCQALQERPWLGSEAKVYLETPAKIGFPPLPAGWNLVRDRQAGQVRFGLAETGESSPDILP